VFAVVACVLMATLGLLLVPVRISFDAEPRQQPSFQVRLSWLFGLVQCGLTSAGDAKRAAAGAAHPRSKARGRRPRGVLALLRSAGVSARLRRLVSDLVNNFQPEIERLRIELGLADAADTGCAWAVMGPLSGWLMYRYPGRISLEPNFTERVIRVEGHGQVTIIPLLTFGILIGFLVSPSVLRGLYAAYLEG
jgi:hypothetical protein